MNGTTRLAAWVGLACAALAMAPAASAQQSDHPASVLIFPLYDATPGAGTLLCVTNTNTETTFCPLRDNRIGDVLLHYFYVDGETWLEFDRFELLTPGDTLCVVASEHNLDRGRGFLVVTALDPNTENLVEFDHLIGSAILVQSDLNFLWTYAAYGMQAGGRADSCLSRNPDDVANGGDGDGVPDFDTVEYSGFPEIHMIDTFFEEGGSHGFQNELTILSTSGPDYKNELDFLFFNNIEQKFSRSFQFTCWWSGPLSDISTIATDLRGDEEELGRNTQTGWVRLSGRRILDGAGNPVRRDDSSLALPPFLAVFMQGVTDSSFAFGKNLHVEGTIDGMEIQQGNGDPQTTLP